jgi:hypothetical protein
MPYPQVQPHEITVYPLQKRKSKSKLEKIIINPDSTPPEIAATFIEDVDIIVEKILKAKKNNASVMLACGAHLIKNGAASIVIKLLEKGWITHIATNGAGGIHDWEFAFQGESEENVRENVETGTFGTWEETGKYTNLAVQLGAISGMGYGESLGALIHQGYLDFPDEEELEDDIAKGLRRNDALLSAKVELLQTIQKFGISGKKMELNFPFKQFSIAGNAYRLRVPLTIHPGIGYDIIYNNPYANGAALGRGAHTDYNTFVHSVKKLSNGVFLSVGSAIMAPQIFEKAISFANNILLKSGQKIKDHYLVVDDLQESTWDWSKGEPPKESPDYYLRFLKSFYRMGGTVKYVSLDNRTLLHHIYHKLLLA